MTAIEFKSGLALATAALILAVPSTAPAALVYQEQHEDPFYAAEPGENNELVVTHDTSAIIFADSAPLEVGAGCLQLDAHTARCNREHVETVFIDVGDGSNTVNAATVSIPVQIDSGGGNRNTLYGGSEADVIVGASGDDVLHGGLGDDQLEGASGSDSVSGGGGDDDVSGGYGADELRGGAGQDDLAGAQGADLLDGGVDADSFDGGPDRDLADYSSRTTAVRVSPGTSGLVPNDGELGEGDHVAASVEDIRGGSGDDVLSAASVATDNTILAGAGADTLEGGPGADLLQGGPGSDRVSYERAPGPVRADLANTPANDGELGEGDTIVEVEELVGSAFDDVLRGSAGNNLIAGGAGRDRIDGLRGRDLLEGEAGRDVLRSRDRSRDRVRCGAGSDRARADRKDSLRRCERS